MLDNLVAEAVEEVRFRSFERNFLKFFNDMYYQMIPFSFRKFEACV